MNDSLKEREGSLVLRSTQVFDRLVCEPPRDPTPARRMTEPPRRVVGKRQVRPNLSRTDFGYTERPRVPVQKAAKKLKRADEEDEAGGATTASDRPARADKDSRSLVRQRAPD